jgi:nucleoside-diphosphate-sugar epimerase
VKPSRILVAGAGYLGKAFAGRMSGSEITLARRSPVEVVGMRTISCDFSSRASLAALPPVDLVYFAVAADGFSETSYELSYFTCLKNLVDQYQEQPVPPTFVYSSSTSVYAAKDGEACTENSPLTDSGPSRFIAAGENYLLESRLKSIVVRYGGIYGPGRDNFVRRVRDRLEPLTPTVPQYTNRIHQFDAVDIVRFLFERGCSGVFNAVDEAPSLRDDVIAFLASEMGLDLSTYPRGPTAMPRGHKRVLSDKLQALGYRFVYPSFREGYRDGLIRP